MNKVFGVVSLHRLRTGATIQLYLSANKGLYQNVAGSTITPDWSVGDEQPTVTPYITGVEESAISKRKWYKMNEQGTKVLISSDSTYSIDTTGKLRFLQSPITDKKNAHNLTYIFECTVTTGGKEETVERSIMVLVNAGGENSYWGNINAPDGTVLGELTSGSETKTVTSITLTPTLWCGATKVDDSNYSVAWYKTAGQLKDGKYIDLPITGSGVSGQYALSGKQLTVFRNGVDGMAHFECHFKVNDTFVEAEGIQIVDNADEYFMTFDGDRNVYDQSKSIAKITASVYTHKTNKFVRATQWAAVVTDSVRMNEYNNSLYNINSTNGKGVFTMSESNMYVPNTGNPQVQTGETVGSWLKTDVEYQEDGKTKTKDIDVTNTDDATPCGVVIQFVASEFTVVND